MQAIQIRYLQATNTLPARMKVITRGLTMIVHFKYGSDDKRNEQHAAMEILKKLEWRGTWVGGSLPNNDYCFVCVDWNTPLMVGI